MVNVLSLLKAIVSQIFVKRIERSSLAFFSFNEGSNRLSMSIFVYLSGPYNSSPASQVRFYDSTWSTCVSSQVEWELVEVHVAGDCANFRAETSNLVSQHAWSRNLNGIVPIVVIVTERVGEVKNRHLRDFRRILGHIEVSRLDRTLSHGMWNQEEVKLSICINFGLLNKASIDVGSLRWVVDEVLPILHILSLLEKSLADSFIHND